MELGRGYTRVVVALLASVLLVLLVAPGAGAHPPAPVGPKGKPLRGSFHRWLHEARVPLVGGRIQILLGGCPGYPRFAGCVFSARPRRIYLRRGLRDPRTLLYHELGHVFDLRVMNRRDRRAFKRVMRLRGPGWYRGSPSPSEQFADGYALCARRRTVRGAARRSAYGYRPSARQHERVCTLIARAAGPRSRPPQRPKTPPELIETHPPPPPPEQRRPEPHRCDLLETLLSGCRAS